ncbi:hypothetical protein EVAR_51567_1 [Eumeta japonica]|uniref:Uncharacterized protein n=1 Tax=Eumeta variegata TaxID=151549 RepID=A0A4C1Z7Z5_EUMVA|nr:hypothetical protein EVAR_51567_1 [Eumeta japonica]
MIGIGTSKEGTGFDPDEGRLVNQHLIYMKLKPSPRASEDTFNGRFRTPSPHCPYILHHESQGHTTLSTPGYVSSTTEALTPHSVHPLEVFFAVCQSSTDKRFFGYLAYVYYHYYLRIANKHSSIGIWE